MRCKEHENQCMKKGCTTNKFVDGFCRRHFTIYCGAWEEKLKTQSYKNSKLLAVPKRRTMTSLLSCASFRLCHCTGIVNSLIPLNRCNNQEFFFLASYQLQKMYRDYSVVFYFVWCFLFWLHFDKMESSNRGSIHPWQLSRERYFNDSSIISPFNQRFQAVPHLIVKRSSS